MATSADAARFDILGRRLHARLRSPAIIAWLETHWRFDEHAAPENGFAITLEEVPRAPEFGDPANDGAATTPVRLPDGVVQHWRGDDGSWQTGGAGWRVSLELGRADARILVHCGADPPAELYPALYLALTEAVRGSGLIPLHAAILARRGRATALAGPSGTGKTTTLLRLLRAGWHPLAEDLSWLDPDTLTVHGWDRGVRVWPGTVERFAPELAGAPWQAASDGKRFLPYDALGSAPARSASLTRVIVLTRDPGGASDVEPLPGRDAVRAFWETTGVPLAPDTRDALARRSAGLLDRLAFLRLRLGPGPLPPLVSSLP